MNYHFKLGLLMACLLFLFSCQKEEILDQSSSVEDTVTLESIVGNDPLLDKFFNGIADHDTIVDINNKDKVDKIKLAMAKDHLEIPFVGDYVRQVGFPLWGQAKLNSQGGGHYLYALPFAKSNSNSTTAILNIAASPDGFIYELALRTDITNYLAAYDNGTNDFYWENLMGFLLEFITYDGAIFNFENSYFINWFNQNEESYLTNNADTRNDDDPSCETVYFPYCKTIYPLQETGQERSLNCDGTYQRLAFFPIVICTGNDDFGINQPHQPGGQTGGVPGIGGGGSSSNNGSGSDTSNNGPSENPNIDPSTWGDEGSGLPTDLQAAVLHNFLDSLETLGQLEWFNRNAQQDLKTTIINRIFANPIDLSFLPNAYKLIDLMEEYDLELTSEEIHLFLNNFNQIKHQMVLNILENFKDIDQTASTEFVHDLVSCIPNPTCSEITKITEFISTPEENEVDKTIFVDMLAQLKAIDPDIKNERGFEIYNLLLDDVDALVKCGIPPADIEDWEDIASFIPPQTVLDRLPEEYGWKLQPLTTPSNAPSVNLDYFSTEITEMPMNSTTGEPFTEVEFFNFIRKNINTFMNTDNSEFLPLTTTDNDLWQSDNPIGATFSINIAVPHTPLGDDGSVICAQAEPNFWIFSTVTAPFIVDNPSPPLSTAWADGFHPVSGSRQFGFFTNDAGNMEIFTRGADRYWVPTSANPSSNGINKLFGYILENFAFLGADSLWGSFQERIRNYVTAPPRNGEASIKDPIKLRPPFQEAMKTLLKQETPITNLNLPCGE